MDIVADTGPILAFARSHRLDLLQRVVGALIIPQAVYEELVTHSSGKPGANEVRTASWILRQAVKDPVFVEQLPARLHLGEREAIGLAREHGAVLLVDEREARKRSTEE